MLVKFWHEYRCAEEMKEGSSVPKYLGLLKTLEYKEDNKTPHGGSGGCGRISGTQAWTGGGPYGAGFFFPTPTVLQAWILLTLCFPSNLKAQQEQPVSPYMGLQGVGQLLLKLLVKLSSPALAWIPEFCGADFTDQKLRVAAETPAVSFPICNLSPTQSETQREGVAVMCAPEQAAGLPLPSVKRHNQCRARIGKAGVTLGMLWRFRGNSREA